MERSRAVLVTLICVLFSRISGAEVEMRVRAGDSVVLYCDCVWKTWPPVWFRKSLNEGQPPLIISGETLKHAAFSRYSLMWNEVNQTNDLLVTNFSESDLGLYYCALRERKPVKDGTGAEVLQDVYHNGTRTTRLSLLDSTSDPLQTPFTIQTPSTPPVSECSVCWKLLVSVCPMGVLLSSVVSSICVYCICRKRTEGEKKDNEGKNGNKENQKRTKHGKAGGADGGADGVVYTPVKVTSQGQNCVKKNRVERSDICTYSEVKHGQR